MVPFAVVILVILTWFDHAFRHLLNPSGDSPFTGGAQSMVTVFLLMLGDFDRGWFEADSYYPGIGIGLFVTFQIIVQVIMLNVLIAVVSDNHEFAQTRSQ